MYEPLFQQMNRIFTEAATAGRPNERGMPPAPDVPGLDQDSVERSVRQIMEDIGDGSPERIAWAIAKRLQVLSDRLNGDAGEPSIERMRSDIKDLWYRSA